MAIAPVMDKPYTFPNGRQVIVDHVAGGAHMLTPTEMHPMLFVSGLHNGIRHSGWIKRAGTFIEERR